MMTEQKKQILKLKGRRAAKKNLINVNKSYLDSTDYQAIKYAEGVMSLAEYESIKNKRQEARAAINNIEAEIIALDREIAELEANK